MTDEQKARCRVIASHYGVENQKYKACEEMAELIQVLMKTETEKIDFSYFENIIDELADVCIMIEQLRFLFGEVDVDNRIVAKLNRQLKRMERENDE
jgi:3-phosphoglycerate kinase